MVKVWKYYAGWHLPFWWASALLSFNFPPFLPPPKKKHTCFLPYFSTSSNGSPSVLTAVVLSQSAPGLGRVLVLSPHQLPKPPATWANGLATWWQLLWSTKSPKACKPLSPPVKLVSCSVTSFCSSSCALLQNKKWQQFKGRFQREGESIAIDEAAEPVYFPWSSYR